MSSRFILWLCDRLLVVVSIRLFSLFSFMKVLVCVLRVMFRCVILVSLWVMSVVCVFKFSCMLLVMFVVIVIMFLIVFFIFILIGLLEV